MERLCGNSNQTKAGIVIPVVSLAYLDQCLKNLHLPSWAKCVVVNDGNKSICNCLQLMCEKYNVDILHLDENKGFSYSNNYGWKWLVDKYNPSYLATLNSDTIPRKGWLESLVKSIETNNVSLSMPRQLSKRGYISDCYTLKGLVTICEKKGIKKDIICNGVYGFCFLARADHLKEVDYFDENYRNGCEDTDLALKLYKHNLRICVSYNSVVKHFGGKSRWKKGTITNTNFNHSYKRKKWLKFIRHQIKTGEGKP